MTSAGYRIELTRKRVKNINLRIHPPDGACSPAAHVGSAHRGVRRRQSRLIRHHQARTPPSRPAGVAVRDGRGAPVRGARVGGGRAPAGSEPPPSKPRPTRRHPASSFTPATRTIPPSPTAPRTPPTPELQRLDALVPGGGAARRPHHRIRIRAMKRKRGVCARHGRRRFQPQPRRGAAARHRIPGCTSRPMIEPSHGPRLAILTEHMPIGALSKLPQRPGDDAGNAVATPLQR